MKIVTTSTTFAGESLDGVACPDCGGQLKPWGYARTRVIRTADSVERLTPRRTRCADCRRTHVLLPEHTLPRRLDTVDTIGSAVDAWAAGDGHRRIARRLGVPRTTVRDWIRRFGSTWTPTGAAAAGATALADLQATRADGAGPDDPETVRTSFWSWLCRKTNGSLLTRGPEKSEISSAIQRC
jgi:hypothetical protein